MKSRGCWTCKERKVRCDRGLPTCQSCARAQRPCQGYGLRLSWPRENDQKRSMTAVDASGPQRHAGPAWKGRRLFVHTTGWDVELYRRLSRQRDCGPAILVQPMPLLRQPPPSAVQRGDLLAYFHDAAYLSLVTFGRTPRQIRDVLMRMCLCDGRGSDTGGRALLCALLAVSSLRRSGVQPEAVRLKVAALAALSSAVRQQRQTGGSASEALQLVAASMLLCTYEIELPTASSGEWLWYVQGAMDLVRETRLEQQLGRDGGDPDRESLVEWTYYHTALSRFSTQHWQHRTVAVEKAGGASPGETYPPVRDKPTPPSRRPVLAVLDLLGAACSTVIDPWDPRSRETEYQQRLQSLRLQVESMPAATSLRAMSPDTAWTDAERTAVAVELFRASTLVYLVRAGAFQETASATCPDTLPSQQPSTTPLDALVASVYAMPLQMHRSCDHFFPLLILGSEAHSDQQRATILAMVDRTERTTQARSMQRLRAGLQAVWAQMDLHADGDVVLNYFRMMDAVVSANSTLPSYV